MAYVKILVIQISALHHSANTHLDHLQRLPSDFDDEVFEDVLLFNGCHELTDTHDIRVKNLGLLEFDSNIQSLKILEAAPASSSDNGLRAEREQWELDYKKTARSSLTPRAWAELKVGTVFKAISIRSD
jgi:hypothetical protein